jgi:hypothetical protein
LPDDEFLVEVAAFTDGDRWIVDGNYGQVREHVVWPRADTVVWVDPTRAAVMRRVVWRSIRRVVGRQELWNGNREQWRFLLSWNPERSIIRWAWTRFHLRREEMLDAIADTRWGHLHFVRLSSKEAVRTFTADARERQEAD